MIPSGSRPPQRRSHSSPPPISLAPFAALTWTCAFTLQLTSSKRGDLRSEAAQRCRAHTLHCPPVQALGKHLLIFNAAPFLPLPPHPHPPTSTTSAFHHQLDSHHPSITPHQHSINNAHPSTPPHTPPQWPKQRIRRRSSSCPRTTSSRQSVSLPLPPPPLACIILTAVAARKHAERSMLIKNMIEDLGDPGSEPIPIMNVSPTLPHLTPTSPSPVLTHPRTGLA